MTAALTIGVDLGGTSVRVGVFNAEMSLLSSQQLPTNVGGGPQAFVEELSGVVAGLLTQVGVTNTTEQVKGLGIGSPGPINLRTGMLGILPNLPGWERFPLRDALAKASGLPVWLECDANAAAIAEWKLGAGKDASVNSMAMLTLGTGVGSGLILNGHVWHGMFGMGGEAGHACIVPGGLLCGCGSRGCLEMYTSAKGLVRIAKELAQTGQATEALQELLAEPATCTPLAIAALVTENNDASAHAAFEKLGYYLGIGIANLINTLDLPVIVVGGGVAGGWPLFSPSMFRTVREYSVVYRLATPSQLEVMEADRTFIRPAALGSSAGLLGAALLPRL